jgi:hypothetical protein
MTNLGVINVFGKKRTLKNNISKSIDKHKRSSQASEKVDQSEQVVDEIEKQIGIILEEKEQALERLRERWSNIVEQVSEIQVRPYQKDILLDLFGLAWFPYYVSKVGEEIVELPAYSAVMSSDVLGY